MQPTGIKRHLEWTVSYPGLNDELKSHVILNRPTTFDEAESLARLKDAVNKSARCGKTDVHGPTRLISQIQDLLTDQKKESTVAPISMSYRTGNTGTQD